MNNHDKIKQLETEQKTDSDLIKQLAPELSDLSLDIQEIRKNGDKPLFLSLLMFRLVKEREKTNQILEHINEKYDKMMFELKTNDLSKESVIQSKSDYNVLPEQDRVILDFVDQNQGSTAKDVKSLLNYKGLNAASQRLNKLYKEGHLKKVNSGRKVLFLIR